MTTETVDQVSPVKFGIEPKKAEELMGNLPQIKSERSVLETQYSEIITMDIEDPKTSKLASALRKQIKENRTKGIEVWHKNAKEFFLKGGQFVDAIKRMEVAVNERMEEKLEEIEKFQQIKEAQIKEELRLKRSEELQPYAEFVPVGIDLGGMSGDDFTKTLNGAKLQHEAKLEAERKAEEERVAAEKKAEEERIAKEKAEAEERERIRLENERLAAEKAEADRKAAEVEAALKAEREKAEAEKRAAEEAARKEREEIERKAAEEVAKIKAEADRKLKEEQEAKAKLDAELKAKKDAEEAERLRVEAEEKAKRDAEIKLAKSGDKKRLKAWVESMEITTLEISTMKPESQELYDEINNKHQAFKDWAISKINAI